MKRAYVPLISGVALLLGACVFLSSCGNANTKERKPVVVSGTAVFDKRVRGTNNFVTVNQQIGVLTGIRSAPIRFARVEAVTVDSPNTVLGIGQTDASGNFSVEVDNNKRAFFLRVFTKTGVGVPYQAEVVNPANQNSVYFIQSDPLIEASVGLFLSAPINPVNCQSPPPASEQTSLRRVAPAFNIYDQFVEGGDFLFNSVGVVAPKVMGIWLDGRANAATPVTSYLGFRTNKGLGTVLYDNVVYKMRTNADGTFTLTQGDQILFRDVKPDEIVGEIDINGDTSTDPDHYDDHVLLETYWRFIQHVFSRDDAPQPEVKSDFTKNEQLDLRVAFSQGFAKFFACAVLRDSIYLDTRAIAGCDPNATAQPTSSIDIERQDNMAPLGIMTAPYPIFDKATSQLVQIDVSDSTNRDMRADSSTTYSGLSRGYAQGGIAQVNYGNASTPPTMNDILASAGTGYGNELAIAALLFDLFDAPAQNPADRLDKDGSRRNPINNLLIDSYTLGFAPIWSVMSQWMNNQTFACLGDFIDGWYAVKNVDRTDSPSVVSFDNLLDSVGVYYRASDNIGSPLAVGTSPFDTFPKTTAIFGATPNPVRGNNVTNPSPALSNLLAVDVSSSADPFNGGAAISRTTWRTSSAFYTVQIPVPGRLRIELTLNDPGTGGSDLDLYLYSPNGALLASSAQQANLEVIDHEVAVGFYTFEVRSYQTASGTNTYNTTSKPYDVRVFRPN